MSMLTIIRDFFARTGLEVPATVMGTTDTMVSQARALLEEEGSDLSVRGSWEALTEEASHTTVATQSQGLITAIASGFRYIKNQTLWDRTNQLPIFGPLSASEWQADIALVNAAPRYSWRIRGGEVLINPVPTAGYSWNFEYASTNWIVSADGLTRSSRFNLDTDLVLLPEQLLLLGLRWRWKKEKGFEYAEDMRTYEMQLKDALGRDGGKQVVRADLPTRREPMPGVFIRAGNFVTP